MRAVALAFAALSITAGPAAAAAFDTTSSAALLAAPFSAPGESQSLVAYRPGDGLVRWEVGTRRGFVGGADLRLSTASVDANPVAGLLRPQQPLPVRESVELTFIRDWPAVISVQRRKLSLDITPHAGLGLSSSGGRLTEVGAMMRLGSRVMDAVGADDALQGSRLFLFAGFNRRATGLGLLPAPSVGRKDDSSVVRQAETGVSFRRGAMLAAFGYTNERTTLKGWGARAYTSDRVGLTVSIRPSR
jgi:hypothetical protein